jgi:phosphatidate cytidylyltransferase
VTGGSVPDAGEASMSRYPEWFLRVNSAIVLIVVALALAYASQFSFAVLIAVFVTAMAWEWGRLVRGAGLDLAFALQAVTTALASFATAGGFPGYALFAVLAGAVIVLVVRLLRGGTAQEAAWSAAGVCYAGIPGIALVWFRGDPQFGWLAVLYLFLIVWTTDTAAYVFGRTVGGPKLAPRISPKKTWSGFLGGASSAALIGALFGLWIGGTSSIKLALLSLVLAMAAQCGDLGESALKRHFGIKDSSGLIPGHGGVLDRLDGLIFAAFTAAVLAWVTNPTQPGRALLLWS